MKKKIIENQYNSHYLNDLLYTQYMVKEKDIYNIDYQFNKSNFQQL